MPAVRFVIQGELSSPVFERWIRAHADRIGIDARIGEVSESTLSVRLDGPDALLDAMEMACLLGPIDVWVETIRRELA